MTAPRQQTSKPRTAAERLTAIVPLVEYLTRKAAGRAPAVTLADGSVPRTSEDVAHDIAGQRGISRGSVWRWYMLFERAGGCSAYAALARRTRSDKNRRRYFEARPYVAELLARLVLRKKLSPKAAHDSIRSHISQPPCLSTVLAEVRRLRPRSRAARRHERKGGRA